MDDRQGWRAEIERRREMVRHSKENLSAEIEKSEELRRSWERMAAPDGDAGQASALLGDQLAAMQDAMVLIDQRQVAVQKALRDLHEAAVQSREPGKDTSAQPG